MVWYQRRGVYKTPIEISWLEHNVGGLINVVVFRCTRSLDVTEIDSSAGNSMNCILFLDS